MIRIYAGALMVIAGIAAFIEAHSNHPVAATPGLAQGDPGYLLRLQGSGVDTAPHAASGLSPTAYDLLRIGAWALVILGVLTLLLGLIRYLRAPSQQPASGLQP